MMTEEDLLRRRRGALPDRSMGRPSTPSAVGMASMFSGAGDVEDVQSAITGEYRGQKLSTWERLVGALPGVGLAAVVPMGLLGAKRATLVDNAFHRAQSARANRAFRESNPGALQDVMNRLASARPDIDKSQRGVSWLAPQSERLKRFVPWNRTAPPPEHVFGTTGRFTNRQLLARSTDDVYGDLARGLRDIGRVDPAQMTRADIDDLEGAIDPKWVSDHSKWLYGLGKRLTSEVEENALAGSLYERADDFVSLTTGYELSRFYDSVKNGRLAGERGTRAGDIFDRVRKGKDVSADEYLELSDAIVGHAKLVEPFTHPELSLHPYLWVKGVDLEQGSVSMGVLPFSRVSLREATPELLDQRLKYIAKNNPQWFADAARDSVLRFWRQEVKEEDVQRFADWYPKFKADIEQAASHTGFNARKLTSIASILSAGETAEDNVEKAAQAVLAMRKKIEGAKDRRGLVGSIHEDLKAQGFKVSEPDVQRLILLDSVIPDEASVEVVDEFWYQGAKTAAEAKAAGQEGKLSIAEVIGQWEDGGDLRQLIKAKEYKPGVGLKQPSFDDAIWRSGEDEVIERALMLSRMVAGDVGRSDVPGDSLRRSVPVVSDRQAFKMAIGFSMNPGTWFSGDVGAYDAVSQGIRQAAIELAEETGRFLSPEEIQAVTWMRYREAAQVTSGFDPKAKTPKGTWSPGFTRQTTAKAGMPTSGGGPDWIGHRQVLDVVLGEAPGADFLPRVNLSKSWRNQFRKLRSQDLSPVDPSRPQDVRELGWDGRSSLQEAGEFELKLKSDGTFDVIGAGDVPVRGLASSVVREPDGRQVMFPSRPDRVRDAEDFIRNRELGTAFDPARPELWIGAQGGVYQGRLPEQVFDGRPVVGVSVPVKGGDPEAVLNGLAAEVRRQGVNVSFDLWDTPHKSVRTAVKGEGGVVEPPPAGTFRKVTPAEFVPAITEARAMTRGAGKADPVDTAAVRRELEQRINGSVVAEKGRPDPYPAVAKALRSAPLNPEPLFKGSSYNELPKVGGKVSFPGSVSASADRAVAESFVFPTGEGKPVLFKLPPNTARSLAVQDFVDGELAGVQAERMIAGGDYVVSDVSLVKRAGSDGNYYEVTLEASPERKVGETVYQYADEEYGDMDLYLTEDGLTGYAIKKDGDVVSLFNVGEKGRGEAGVRDAVARGGRKLDAFDEDGFLPQEYARYGFTETGRDTWNPEYAPEGWRGGEPDVVYMENAPEVVDEPRQMLWLYPATEADLEQAVKLVSRDHRDIISFATSANPPEGFQRAFMRVVEDEAGRTGWTISRSGDGANSVPVDVPEGRLPETNESMTGTATNKRVKSRGQAEWEVDGRVVVRAAPLAEGVEVKPSISESSATLVDVGFGQRLKFDENGDPVFNDKGNQAKENVRSDQAVVEIPERGLPVVTFGHGELAPIAVPAGTNTVRLERTGHRWDFVQGDDGLPLWLVEETRQLFARLGHGSGFGVKEP